MARQNASVHLGGGRSQRANGRLKLEQKNERGAPTLKNSEELLVSSSTRSYKKLSLHSLGAQSGQLFHLFLTFS